jgi:polyisoprenoid-binding protein YceI
VILGPEAATLEVLTFREGVLAAAAHDLLLRVSVFTIAVDPALPAVEVTAEAGSLRVEAALRDGRPLAGALSAADVRDIERTIAETVLRAGRFPVVRFRSTEVSRGADATTVRGELSLAGVRREIAFAARPAGERLVAEIVLHQPAFGIRPYRAMLGALKVKPDVIVRASLPAAGL